MLTGLAGTARAQCISGSVVCDGQPVAGVTITTHNGRLGTITDSLGRYRICPDVAESVLLRYTAVGYLPAEIRVHPAGDTLLTQPVELRKDERELREVVVSGTLNEVDKKESPVNVEVYTPRYLQKNPTSNFFESLQIVNGVRPQINCSVCNTGDIHINGMEGPYTMVTIDGMPIVSSLSTVYGLMGIPNGIVERIEVVKGPASTLYGSEAMGGLVNVITKSPGTAPLFSAGLLTTSYGDLNLEGSVKAESKSVAMLLGLDYYTFSNRWDINNDGFTDVPLQQRVSLFSKWSFKRKQNRLAHIAGRFVYEDRFGGEMHWDKQWRGSDSIYGESIYTHRAELIGMYQLPVKEKIYLSYSYTYHHQDSYYGTIPYQASQHIAFAQLYWNKPIGKRHLLVSGLAYRFTWYDDNTPGTASADSLQPTNRPQVIHLPGIFVQEEWSMHPKHKLLAGLRFDYSLVHGSIFSPRINYKWSPHANHILRLSLGNGYRVVNLFTEDHAALTGSRQVVITENLLPETSYNASLNYNATFTHAKGFVNTDVTGFFTYFGNKIVGDYLSDPNQIIYANLDGYAVSAGVSVNLDFSFTCGLRLHAGASYMQVYQMQRDSAQLLQRHEQYFAPRWSGTFSLSYALPGTGWSADLTGQWNGPMRLPVLPGDYRPEYSPWYLLMNLQITKKWTNGMELFAGAKNILNFLPRDPLMRPFDPFDKYVNDPVNNPNGYTFDTAYNYAPLQGVRAFFGFRYALK